MLDDDFSLFNETTNLNEDSTDNPGLSDINLAHNATTSEHCNAATDGKKSCSSSVAAVAANSQVQITTTSKGSPFTKFLFDLVPRSEKPKGQETGGGTETAISAALFDSDSSQRDILEERLKPLISEASDDARDKMQRRPHNLVPPSQSPRCND